jgi:hypothetical protein
MCRSSTDRQAVYGLFRRWQRAGSWAAIVGSLQVLADAAGVIDWQVSVDSTITRAHPHAAGARRDSDCQAEPPAGPGEREPADHGLGRSRGGWTSKLHLACDQGCRVLSVLITAGQAGGLPLWSNVIRWFRKQADAATSIAVAGAIVGAVAEH